MALESLSQSTAPAEVMSETGRTISGKSVGGSCWRGTVCKSLMRENSRNLLASSKREKKNVEKIIVMGHSVIS